MGSSGALSFNDLYAELYPSVHGRCLRLLGNHHDAEDVTQEAFQRLAERLAQVDQPLPWLLRVAGNLCVDQLRRQRVHDAAMDREGARTVAPSVDPADAVHEPAVLLRLLARLTPAERSLVVDRWLRGTSLEDSALRLGIAGSTARSLMFRARRKIGEAVRRYCAGLETLLTPPWGRAVVAVSAAATALALLQGACVCDPPWARHPAQAAIAPAPAGVAPAPVVVALRLTATISPVGAPAPAHHLVDSRPAPPSPSPSPGGKFKSITVYSDLGLPEVPPLPAGPPSIP